MGAPAARVAELAHHWHKSGHEVTILTGFPNHPTGVLAPAYRRQFRRLVMREQVGGVNVVRTWLLPLPNRKPHERILNYSSFCLSSAITGLFLPQPDVVIATSPQLLVGLSGWWLARWKGVPFVFEVRDLWPESLDAIGMGDRHSLLHRTLSTLARFLYKSAAHIVVVTSGFKEYLTENWAIFPEKMSVVENGVETSSFSPRKDSGELKKELGAHGKFLVSYVGTIGLAHGLDTLVDAADNLQSAAPNVMFLLVGEGADKKRIQNLASSRGLRNIAFVDQQPRERIPDFISASDACVVLLNKNEIFKTVIPTKMLEFMSCAKPVILAVEGEAKRILELGQAGIAVEPENSAELTQTILQLAQNTALCELLGRNGRAYVARHFSRQQKALEYIYLLESLQRGTAHQGPVAATFAD